MLHFHQHSCLFPVFDFMRMLQWNDSKNGTSVQCDAHINACMYCIPDMLYVFTPNPHPPPFSKVIIFCGFSIFGPFLEMGFLIKHCES